MNFTTNSTDTFFLQLRMIVDCNEQLKANALDTLWCLITSHQFRNHMTQDNECRIKLAFVVEEIEKVLTRLCKHREENILSRKYIVFSYCVCSENPLA